MLFALKKTNRGFTLIELLVVIAIIGILSSVILASLSTARQKSRDAKRISDVEQIQLSLELFYDANQMYPSTTPSGYSGDDAGVQMLVAGGFLTKVPVPPVGPNTTYIYHGVTALATECLSVGIVCTNYELGITLERSDNPALANDYDQSVGTFYGTYPNCLVNTAGTEYCYDVRK